MHKPRSMKLPNWTGLGIGGFDPKWVLPKSGRAAVTLEKEVSKLPAANDQQKQKRTEY